MDETVVAGRYRLLELIGSGGMGRVWRAHDVVLDRGVAVKEIITAQPDESMREARAAARLDHPGVVRVLDVLHSDGRSWIVMQYVKSRSLSQIIDIHGRLGHAQVAAIGVAVLNALQAAHRAGVLHRDVKPGNVLVALDGRIVLTDFGLAALSAAGAVGGPVSPESSPRVGSPFFVAPERLRAGTSGVAADLWSLGATLYTALEGRPPYARATTAESIDALLAGDIHPIRQPGPVHPLIAGLLAADPEDRPTASRALRVLAPLTRRAVGVSAVPATTPVKKRPRRRVGLVVVAAIGAALLAGAGAKAVRPDVKAVAEVAVYAGPCMADPQSLIEAPAAGRPYALPEGWIWHADPAGFRLAVPTGWSRLVDGTRTCFRSPDGIRVFTVDTHAPVTGTPLEFWKNVEQSEALAGYRRIGMDVLLLAGGGGDWEYTWKPAEVTWHARRILLSTGDGRAVVLRSETTDADWQLNLVVQRRVVTSFDWL